MLTSLYFVASFWVTSDSSIKSNEGKGSKGFTTIAISK